MSGPLGSSQWAYASDTDYSIDYSCRFDGESGTQFTRTPSSTGSRRKLTFACWFKNDVIDTNLYNQVFFSCGVNGDYLGTQSSSIFRCLGYGGSAGANTYWGTRDFEPKCWDPCGWHHLMFTFDTDQANEVDRSRLWLDGIEMPHNYTYHTIARYYDMRYNHTADAHWIGALNNGSHFQGYMAEIHWLDGTAKTNALDFGEFGDYGEFKPKEVSGLTYGTNGFYLNFSNASDLGEDFSGNNNDWTYSSPVASDQMLDTPTNNFCTWNPADTDKGSNTNDISVTEGNLKLVNDGGDTIRGTLAVTSGKWYFEAIPKTTCDGSNPLMYGIMGALGTPAHSGLDRAAFMYSDNALNTGIYRFEAGTGGKTTVSGFDSISVDDVLSMAFDMDTGKIWIAKNGSWLASGDPAAGTNPAYTMGTTGDIPMTIGADHAGVTYTVIYNCGQDSSFAGNKTAQGNGVSGDDFYYTPPAGFKSLNKRNLPIPAVIPSEHFAIIKYDDGAGAKTGVGFQPDLVWLKARDSTYEHELTDAVRGVTKAISSDSTNIESTDSTGLTAFGADGFTVGADTNYCGTTGDGMVAWCWKANGAGSANTDGSISSTVSANTNAGFSIVSYTGTGSTGTVGHGLSAAPDMIMWKNRTEGLSWCVWHVGLDGGSYSPYGSFLKLDTTDDAEEGSGSIMNNTAPTSSVFTVKTHNRVNDSNDAIIAYCFHSVSGYSSFGSYTGNNTDGNSYHSEGGGPFVYTGFKPSFVMIKNIDNAADWVIIDTSREVYQAHPQALFPSDTAIENNTKGKIQIFSTGFKCYGSTIEINDADDYIYIAFAEAPFKHSTGGYNKSFYDTAS